MHEIPITTLLNYAAHFPGPQAAMVLASIAEGNTRAQLWTASGPEDDLYLLWDKANNVLYLSSGRVSGGAAAELAALIQTVIRPSALADRRAYFKVHTLTDQAAAPLAQLFEGISLRPIDTLFYSDRGPGPVALSEPGLAGLQLVLIDADFLADERLRNREWVRSEIEAMWPSRERFAQHGYGIAAQLGETIIGWCTAEYASRAGCGIGIATVEEYAGRGIATAMASRFVDGCQRRGVRPHWECRRENPASVRVAEKVGFRDPHPATFWVGAFQ
jgi:RimJ/RimL family protein N-acetyltransferase